MSGAPSRHLHLKISTLHDYTRKVFFIVLCFRIAGNFSISKTHRLPDESTNGSNLFWHEVMKRRYVTCFEQCDGGLVQGRSALSRGGGWRLLSCSPMVIQSILPAVRNGKLGFKRCSHVLPENEMS